MGVCQSCGDWNPDNTRFCSLCGTPTPKAKLINRKFNWLLLVVCGVLLPMLIHSEAGRRIQNVKVHTKEAYKLSLALDLLELILEDGANENSEYCIYCKARMTAPVRYHQQNCVWRQAWQLAHQEKATDRWRGKVHHVAVALRKRTFHRI